MIGSDATWTDAVHRLTAFRLDDRRDFQLVPALVERDWMASSSQRFANRCLPLRLANQAGWFVLNNVEVRLIWDGGCSQSAIRIERADGYDTRQPISHFGHAIVTWEIPFLFRTSPGWNLLVRGPANWPKDGAYALEGLVETDWAVATFTMNWMLTRPGVPVTFGAGEPICMLVPQRRRDLEAFDPDERVLASDQTIKFDYEEWLTRRQYTLIERTASHSHPRWDGDYVHGTSPSGTHASDHQIKLSLRSFRDTA